MSLHSAYRVVFGFGGLQKAAGAHDEFRPAQLKPQFQLDADDTVVIQPQFAAHLFAVEDNGVKLLRHRRTLETNIIWRGPAQVGSPAKVVRE